MKKTLFIRTILSVLTTAACFSLSGNTAFAGIHLEYPGCGTDENGNLIITGSPSNNTIHVSTGSIIGAVTGSYSEINDTTGNSVSVSGGTIGGTVIGGFAENDDAISNSVDISGGHIGDDVIGGKSSDDAISNSIQISGGMIDGDVLGASSIHGDVTSNSVTISGGTINKDVLGALSETGDVKNNSVFISGGNVEGYVYGANTDEGKAANNSVTISDEAAIDGYVYGAYSKMGSLTNNSVTILGGTIGDNVYGADSGSGDADATNNSVTISGGAVGDSVYGASSGEGDMTGNSVTISNGSIGDDVIGARSALGDLTNNSITISGGTIGNDVSGAHNLYGKMAENSVTISGGFIGGSVYGAQSFGPEPSSEVPDMKRPELGEALNNSVTISGGDISQDVYGALNIQGNATSNIVLIKGTATVDGSVFGAGSAYGKVKSNSVVIEAGNIGENVSGALFILGNAEENTVIIKGGNIAGSVYGASSLLDGPSRETFAMEGPIFGNALKNAVLIEGGTIGRNVYGALNQVGDASGNIAMIKGGTIGKNVFGARTKEGNAASNTVVIQGESEIDGDVYGAFSKNGNATTNTVSISKSIIGNDVYGAFSKKGSVSDNSVTIHEASIDRDVYGAFSKKGDATGNSVAISKSDIGKNVYGGYSQKSLVTDNFVVISEATIGKSIYGGFSKKGDVTENSIVISKTTVSKDVIGGYSRKGSANGNTVNISGGSIGGDVLGGSSFSFEGELEGAPAGTTSNNTVQITAGTIGGNIYGGFTMAGNATNNTVILGEKAILSDSAVVAGGWSENLVGFRIADQSEVSDSFTGNRLVLDNFRGTVGEISNFEFIDIKTSGRVEDMLVIKKSEGTELLSESNGTPTDLSNVKVSITFTGIAQRANVGDKFILVRNDDGLITDTMTLTQNGQQKLRRSAYIYDLQFGADETTISATVSDRKFNEQCKALAEGRVASMAHLNMGADLIADQGIDQVVQSTHKAGKFSVFAAMAATTSQYDTGSHVDLYGYSVLAGASLRPVALSSLNVGLFAESGWGHYGSFNEFTDGAVRGSGDSEYYGGGVLAHYDLAKAVTKGLSVEASFRTGKTDTDFASGDLPDSRYSLNAPYYGMHAGINYTRQISEKIKMVSYGRFFWSHLDGDSALIDGSDFRFNSMNSQRIKAGAKFFYEIAPHITPYAGASYEWECSGTARAVVDTENGMSAPSLRGGTATGELGAIYQPMAERPFWVDLSVQGHVGERQGISGAVKFRAEF